MAKIYGLFGAMTGKLADTVMAVRNGEQIARKYQPMVFNPSTPAQIQQRAKLKLLSQLSAVMAPVIAFRRKGTASARNIFTKVNFGATSYASNTAEIDLVNVKLTSSVVSLPALSVSRVGYTDTVSVNESEEGLIDRVVFAAFRQMPDNTLRYSGSQVINTPNASGMFEATFGLSYDDASVVYYAYGVRVNSQAARVIFGNLQSPSAEDIAKLITNSSLTESDVTLTETKAIISRPTT